MRVRRVQAEAGTCHADLCGELVACVDRLDTPAGTMPRAFCLKHCAERDAELLERNARGEIAEVVLLADWERGPDGRARRKSDG